MNYDPLLINFYAVVKHRLFEFYRPQRVSKGPRVRPTKSEYKDKVSLKLIEQFSKTNGDEVHGVNKMGWRPIKNLLPWRQLFTFQEKTGKIKYFIEGYKDSSFKEV